MHAILVQFCLGRHCIIMKLLHFIFCILLLSIFKLFQVKSDNAFLTVCGLEKEDGEEYYLDARKCTHGVIFKEPFTPNCTCVRGVWVIKRTICDPNPVIIMGGTNTSEDCYHIGYNVKSILHLGNPNNIFEFHAYVSPFSLTVFEEIRPNGAWTPYVHLQKPTVVAINPGNNMSIESDHDKQCFRKRESELNDKPKVHVWLSSLGTTRFRQVKHCVDHNGAAYDEYATTDEFYYHSLESPVLPIKGCTPGCNLWNDGKPKPRQGGKVKMTYEEWQVLLKKAQQEPDTDMSKLQKLYQERLKSGRKRRKKRKVVNCEMIWDGKGYCIKSFWEPTEKIHMSDKDIELCYPTIPASPPTKLPRYG